MPTSTGKKLREIYDNLYASFGPQHWWPADDSFEVIVGAILTQNTSWKNVEKAIRNLKERKFLSPQGLKSITETELAALIRPSGYYNQKAKKLKGFVKFFFNDCGGDLKAMSAEELYPLRERLLGVKGIGPETADSILLYALEKPIFVVDTYTYRLCSRHNLVAEDASYEQIQNMFMDNLPADVQLFNEFHALIVRLGHLYCRRTPGCDTCPLKGF
ncbi:MAG: endonuclease III domain-containing protein [Deltaproteobacteria bacterium]|nr:MAG: endonuclease III domain-containing protein [Deltaproteobacteria bacterium]